jgi:hypothetical protein
VVRTVRPTAKALSCAATAHVATAARHVACPHLRRAMQAAGRRASCAERGGSAAGPKPGRASFCAELGRPSQTLLLSVTY